MATINWEKEIQPLIKKYKGKKHPLEYNNIYQLVIMVVLSAQDSDKHINQVAPAFFKAFPNMRSLAKADADALMPFLNSVRNFGNKIKWLTALSQKIKDDKNIPTNMDALTALSGIGRKSANVIMREAGVKAEGVIVDLHVIRVANRLGITKSEDPKKIEQDIMKVIPQKDWAEAGMNMSFLGREICRPKPLCPECLMKPVCEFYQKGFYDKMILQENTSKKTAAKKIAKK
ncbi:MAG: endonuclease III [Fimbriimonadaceae bacterium]|nr:endonuclease III [Chitinophagales bacterium]